jgi:hypothetical protein
MMLNNLKTLRSKPIHRRAGGKINVPKPFAAAVARHNKMAEQGKDTDYGKIPPAYPLYRSRLTMPERPSRNSSWF